MDVVLHRLYDSWMRGLAFVLLLAGCSTKGDDGRALAPASESRAAAFECYRVGMGAGAAWRECALKLSSCDKQGCFKRDEAYCFPYLLGGMGIRPDARAMVCTASKEECEEWNKDRQHVPNRALGPCFLAKPDEYIDEPIPITR
jgi:hypothetical protein